MFRDKIAFVLANLGTPKILSFLLVYKESTFNFFEHSFEQKLLL